VSRLMCEALAVCVMFICVECEVLVVCVLFVCCV